MNLGERTKENYELRSKHVNWNDLPTIYKRGCCCIRNEDGDWNIDKEILIFTQNFDYVNRFIEV